MTERCKRNPCCGDYLDCKPPPQFKSRESYEEYERRTTPSPVSAPSPAGGVREAHARAIYEAMGFAYEGRGIGSRGPFGEWATALKAADAIAALSSPAKPEPVSAPSTGEVVEALRRERQTFADAAVISVENDRLREALHDLLTRPTDGAARVRARAALSNPAPGHGEAVPVASRWPFVETPGEFAARLENMWHATGRNFLAAVRAVLIEYPPQLANPAPAEKPAKQESPDAPTA